MIPLHSPSREPTTHNYKIGAKLTLGPAPDRRKTVRIQPPPFIRETSGSNNKKMVVAAFDFDGTLTYRDTLLPFLIHITGFAPFVSGAAGALPDMVRFLFGRLDNQSAKESLLKQFVGGRCLSQLDYLGREFAEQNLERMMRPAGISRLRWHQDQGHYCVLVSASLDVYLKHWSKSYGMDGLICSSLEADSRGVATGKLLGNNCRGLEKVRRLQELLGQRPVHEVYAYGDSTGDRELLSFADKPYYRRFE